VAFLFINQVTDSDPLGLFAALKWFDAKGNDEKYDLGRDLETLAE
jgi:hypothetical protein